LPAYLKKIKKANSFFKIAFGLYQHPFILLSTSRTPLPSLVQTAKRQGVHPLKFMQILLTADTATAQAALYNNST
jgi:hypothetical protein